MRASLCALLLFGSIASAAHAQPAMQTPAAAAATPCDLLLHGTDYDGKEVTVTGEAHAGLDDFVLLTPNCTGLPPAVPAAIWLTFPDGTRAHAGPATVLNLAVAGATATPQPPGLHRPERNAAFKTFDAALSTPLKSEGMCLGCVSKTVTTTLQGRLQFVSKPGIDRTTSGHFNSIRGFGNLNRYAARLIIEEVIDAKPNDISFTAAAPELAMPVPPPLISTATAIPSPRGYAPPRPSAETLDPARALRLAAEVFPNGTAYYGLLRRASVAFGTAEDRNGVTVSAGATNEVNAALDHPDAKNKAADAKANGDSKANPNPDGLVATLLYDPERLNTAALLRAFVLAGTHLADLREGHTTPTALELDTSAYETLVVYLVAARQSSLVLPNGSVLWNAQWQPNERRTHIDATLVEYLFKWKGIRR